MNDEKDFNTTDNEKIIDLTNKSEDEIIKAYKEIAEESYIQNKIYEASSNGKQASETLSKYKIRKQENRKFDNYK